MNTCTMLMCENVKYEYLHYVDVWECKIWILALIPTHHIFKCISFSEVHVTQSLVLCVCFVDCCLSFCTISFGHCVVCSSAIYGFWLKYEYLHYVDVWECKIWILALCWCVRM
jgi:hypothetical protein